MYSPSYVRAAWPETPANSVKEHLKRIKQGSFRSDRKLCGCIFSIFTHLGSQVWPSCWWGRRYVSEHILVPVICIANRNIKWRLSGWFQVEGYYVVSSGGRAEEVQSGKDPRSGDQKYRQMHYHQGFGWAAHQRSPEVQGREQGPIQAHRRVQVQQGREQQLTQGMLFLLWMAGTYSGQAAIGHQFSLDFLGIRCWAHLLMLL